MGREDGRALRDVPGKCRNMAGARQELLFDIWLYKTGEGLLSAFPGLVLVCIIGSERHIIFDDYQQHRFFAVSISII